MAKSIVDHVLARMYGYIVWFRVVDKDVDKAQKEKRTVIYDVLPVMPKETFFETAAIAETQIHGSVWPMLPLDLKQASEFP